MTHGFQISQAVTVGISLRNTLDRRWPKFVMATPPTLSVYDEVIVKLKPTLRAKQPFLAYFLFVHLGLLLSASYQPAPPWSSSSPRHAAILVDWLPFRFICAMICAESRSACQFKLLVADFQCKRHKQQLPYTKVHDSSFSPETFKTLNSAHFLITTYLLKICSLVEVRMVNLQGNWKKASIWSHSANNEWNPFPICGGGRAMRRYKLTMRNRSEAGAKSNL